MVEPSRPDGSIHFTGNPGIPVFHSVTQHNFRHVTGSIQQTPVCFTNIAGFGSNPAEITSVTSIVPDHDIRLKFADQLVCVLPVIIGSTVNSSGFPGATIIS